MRHTPLIRAATGDTADLLIYGAIGEEYQGGIGAKEVVESIRALSSSVQTIRVRVNSLGGSPFAATAIMTALLEERRRGRTVETYIDGIAASAATVITSSGSPIKIASEALMMVHLPYTFTIGNEKDHLDGAAALAQVTNSIIAAYQRTSKLSTSQLRALMEATTWMDADSAIEMGFATQKIDAAPATAAAASAETLACIGNVPAKYAHRFERIVGRRAPVYGGTGSTSASTSWARAFAKAGAR